jgi:2-amino-4-hydroxy-6-hydroxymethyldihydropteridine diphosphokinase
MSQFCDHRNGGSIPQGCIALIGVGANLPGPNGQPALETARQAVIMLDSLLGMRLVGLSRWFETAPIPPSGQPPYINAVAALLVDRGTNFDPAALLAHLMAIEAACGRERSTPNAARTLDLDIIGIGGMVREAPDPILPHPRAHLRAFVLAPLADVAPDWVHPVLRQTAAALLAALPPQAIRPLRPDAR